MAVPNCEQIIRDLAAQHPQEWRDAHNPSGGGPHTEAFVKRVAWVLHSTVDARFGLNGKRGNPNDLSDDALNWIGEGPGHDPATGRPVTVIDFIARAGASHNDPDERNRPAVYWGVIDAPGPGAWVKPEPVGDVVVQPPPASAVWTTAHETIRARMVGSGATSRQIAEQLAHVFPAEQWGQKRTRGGAWSPDTIGRITDGRLWAIRVIPAVTIFGFLDAGHVHQPAAPVDHLGLSVPPPIVVVPPPVVVPPAPVPGPPAPAACDLSAVLAKLDALAATVEAQRAELLAAVRGQSYEFAFKGAPWPLGNAKGVINPVQQSAKAPATE